MYLVVDIGNTRIKGALINIKGEFDPINGEQELIKALTYQSIKSGIYLSTGKNEAIEAQLSSQNNIIKLDHNCPIPIKNSYKSPSTLGPDRLAAVCAAHAIFPYQSCLIVDLGTAITYDIVDKGGIYRGGAISPGLKMRSKALNEYTSKLPLVNIKETPEYTGDDTQSSIASGIYFGIVAEINERITYYSQKFDSLKVILCGGDAAQFESKLKGAIFARPNIVLEGLYEVLKYNA